MRFSVYQESQVGGRRTNQDRMGYCFTRDAVLLLLADGMGGHIGGEVAATITLQTVGAQFQKQAQSFIKNPREFFEASLSAAHFAIHRYRAENNLPDSPRTTVIACLMQHGSAYWAHCGDSRLYWLREREILARTRDHSRIETLIAQGRAAPSERTTHPDRNKLFNCIGGPHLPIIEIAPRASLQKGDVLLLCSDGLWSVLPDDVLATRLFEADIMQSIPQLIASATHIAGKNGDNVTALGVVWEGHDQDHNQAQAISTGSVPVGAVTTTILAPRPADPDQFDQVKDQEIEQAIDDIRSAIEKTSRITLKD
jgi:serine/threonine protein phosphatase PrpC